VSVKLQMRVLSSDRANCRFIAHALEHTRASTSAAGPSTMGPTDRSAESGAGSALQQTQAANRPGHKLLGRARVFVTLCVSHGT
jgi:hypothetical protein